VIRKTDNLSYNLQNSSGQLAELRLLKRVWAFVG